MTLTARLTAFFVATLAVVLVAFSLTLYLVTQTQLYRELDERVNTYRSTMCATVEVEPNGLEWNHNTEQIQRNSGDALEWAVLDESGLVAGSAQARTLIGVLPAPTSDDASLDISLNGLPWRFLSKIVRHPKHHEIVVSTATDAKRYRQLTFFAGLPLTPIHESLQALAWRLMVIASAALLAMTLIARWVCQRALRPLRLMADATIAIRTDDLSIRLPVPPAQDELYELGCAFNKLLARVDEALERQKNFTSEASHQLRTPLTAMLGQVELALRRNRDDNHYKQTLHLVKAQATRLHEMVEMLLFLARADADARLPRFDVVDLGKWLPQYVNTIWAQHSRFDDLQVIVQAEANLQVRIQPELFEQAVGNLIDNAVKYSDPDTPIKLQLMQQGAEAVLYLEDHELGIDSNDIPQLFSPFFRADYARKQGIPGIGLGLAVAARIIRALEGHIAFDSNSSQGSIFSISLPVVMEKSRLEEQLRCLT